MATPSRQSSGSSQRNSVTKPLKDFQLGDSLGKGASGQVYRALNWATGETVAVKEIQLSNIPKGELGEIMSEIDLLKNLNHPNIVKYKGFVKEREYLYIILEFCENGSLHSICKRFGKFPENLVAVYIAQVLEGLVYLHDQGVIHRDIKGGNILTNKDGCVKLADFGVASSTAVTDKAVVGSPYWMAPEVIEQSGATTASDIWSVGCVVIELLEGKHPYHDLEPMQALFRIVQDDCPPIPEGASPIVKDFLYHCFQKDCNLRVSAKKLLKHPWMNSARKQLGGGGNKESKRADETGVSATGTRKPLSNFNYDEAVLKVQEWNEALNSPSRPIKYSKHNRGQEHRQQSPSPIPGPPADLSGSLMLQQSTSGSFPSSSGLAFKSNPKGPAGLVERIREPLVVTLQPPEEQTDNWDDDFEEGISLTKLHALDKTAQEQEEEKHEIEDNGETIRPGRSPSSINIPLPSETDPVPEPSKPPAPAADAAIEDWSDLAAEEDEEWLQDKFESFKMRNSVRKGALFHPNDIKKLGIVPVEGRISPGPASAPLPELFSQTHHRTMSPKSSPKSASPIGLPSRPAHSRASSFVGSMGAGSFGRAEARRLNSQSEFVKYAEDDEEDYDDVFVKPGSSSEQPMQTLQLNTRLSNKSWLGDEDSDEEDPFAEIDAEFADDDLETNLLRDKHARLCSTVDQLIDELTPAAPDFQLRDACDKLLVIMTENPEMQVQLVSSHGMLAILEVLEGKCSRDVIMKLLQIINLLVTSDLGFLESFCLIGGIPIMMGFTSKKHSSECRLEASNFVRLLCHTSVLTLQMFISCRGLKVLVDLLDEDYTEQSDLVVHALNGIGSVFELQSPTTKNDFCRMFIREGLLDPLSTALLNVMTTQGPTSHEMKSKIIQILLVFSQVSQSDIHVRNALGTRKVVRRLLRACELLEPEHLVHMVKAVKHLSMNVNLLEVLQNSNAIEILVKILDEQGSVTEISNHIFQTCYNLCRLNKSRQEEAAQAGIIPSLKRVIDDGSPLKQFALPILCDLAGAGKSCRVLLWQHDGLALYVKLLADPYFQVSALESILSWLQDETARVEDELLKPHAVDALMQCFVSAKANSFENLLDPLLKLCRLSGPLTIALAKAQFVRRLIERLGSAHARAVVRLNLLRLLRAVVDVHPARATLVSRFNLDAVVERLSREDAAVLVRELAREILPALQPAIKGKSALAQKTGAEGQPARTPRRAAARRTASEASGLPAQGSMPVGTRSALGAKPSKLAPGSRHRLGEIAWAGSPNGNSLGGSVFRRPEPGP